MFKKIEIWLLYLVLVVFFIILILFGGILRHHYLGGEKFKLIQSVSVFIAEIPYNFKRIILLADDPGRYFLDESNRLKNEPKSKIFTSSKQEGILLLSRYDDDIKKFVVEVVDLENFQVIHRYVPNSKELIKSVNYKKKDEFKDIHKQISKERLFVWHPYLEQNGELIFNSSSPLFKIDFCSNLIWTMDNNYYHHSIEIDHENNFWVPSVLNPSLIKDENYKDYMGDDGVTKISSDGKLLFEKSVVQILIDNGYKHLLFSQLKYDEDVIHLNDIQPVLADGPYWKKGDIFLSLRSISTVFLYRPSTNKIIKMLRSPHFSYQHDVDIINNKTIYIFNNNLFNTRNGQKIFTKSEIISYDFELDKYTKMYDQTFENHNIKTAFGGLYQRLENGSFMVEEQEHGRLLFFNKDEKLIWQFVNKSVDNKVYVMRWSRIVEDKKTIRNFKKLIREKKCTN